MMSVAAKIHPFGSNRMQIPGVINIANFGANDHRGTFRKIYNQSLLKHNDLFSVMEECFISISQKNVIRGMHFQTPPFDCAKLITVLQGSVIDVICDLRKNSPAFLETNAFVIDSSCLESLYIPQGCAHGFLALEDNTVMLYNTTAEYNPSADKGIRYDSINFSWPISEKNVIISERDLSMPLLEDFETPFIYTSGNPL